MMSVDLDLLRRIHTAKQSANLALLLDMARQAIKNNVSDSTFATIIATGVDVRDASLLSDAINLSHEPRFLSALFAAGVSVHAVLNDFPLLHHVVRRGVSFVRCLLERGADPNVRDNKMFTPLIRLCSYDYVDPHTITALLDAGADPHVHNSLGFNALRSALSHGVNDESVIKMLVSSGARIDEVAPLSLRRVVSPSTTLIRLLLRASAHVESTFNEPGFTFFHLAASLRDSSLMTLLINEHFANVNAVTSSGETPLMVAVGKDAVDVVALLIGARANLNVARADGATALHLAARRGAVDQLIAAGADVNVFDNSGDTPLMSAVRKSDVATVSKLVAAGAQLDVQYGGDGTALHFACRKIVDVLISAGADVNAVNRHGETPLFRAVQFHNRELVLSFVAAGARLNLNAARMSDSVTALHLARGDNAQCLIDAGADPNVVDVHGNTPLIAAVERGDCAAALALIAAGAIMNVARTSKRFSALHVAMLHGAAAQLIAAGADVNAEDSDGETPLMIAVRSADLDAVSKFIAAGARLDVARHRDGICALHWARRDIAEALLVAGADANVKDVHGWTPAHFAAARGDFECVCRLVAVGANVNSVTKDGDTLLHIAAASATSDAIIRLLVEAGGDVNAANRAGRTVCHAAVLSPIAMRTLIDMGADFDRPDRASVTPLQFAIAARNEGTVEILLAAGARWDPALPEYSLLHSCFKSFGDRITPRMVRILMTTGVVDINERVDSLTACDIAVGCENRDCLLTLLAVGATPTDVRDWTMKSSPVCALLLAAGCNVMTTRWSQMRMLCLASETSSTDDELPSVSAARVVLAQARLDLVRARGTEVCIGLQSLRLDALQLCEIIWHACASAAVHVPFHELWAVAVAAKHFKKTR
jgi:cytohesin